MLKKQAMTALDQAKKSSDRERAAILQAEQSAEFERSATLKLAQAGSREEYMLELMTTASQDVAGALLTGAPESRFMFCL